MAGPRQHATPSVRIGAAAKSGFGVPYHYAWAFRPLPDAGALSYSWETLTLPMYSPIGWGSANRRPFRSSAAGVMYQQQGVTLTNLGDPGELSGMFMTQPLLDPADATSQQASVLAVAGVQPGGSFMLDYRGFAS